MDFRLLGPLEVSEGGQRLELGGGKQRALLAVLLLNAGEAVSTDRLIDALWGENVPASALNSVRIYVSQLRKLLGDGYLVTHGRGYVLALEPEQLDVQRFERLLAEGRQLRTGGNPKKAAEVLRSALALWRGPPFADLAYESFAQTEIARLEELRLAALEERIEADLALGRQAELVPELEALVRDHPLRERLRAQLMLALYRSGRQAEALDVYREGRRLLAGLGLEPGPALKERERAILNQDPALAGPPPVPPHGRSMRRRGPLLVAAGAAALLVTVAAVVFAETRGGGTAGLESVDANTVGVIDPESNRILAQVPVGGRPVAVATGLGAVWVANHDDSTLLRVDPKTRRVTRTIGLGAEAADLTVGRDSVWVAGGNDSVVVRVGRDGTIRSRIRLPDVLDLGANPVPAVTVRAGSVWAASFGGLYRIDEETGEVGQAIELPDAPVAVSATSGAVWVVLKFTTVVKVIPALRLVTARLRLGGFLTDVTAGPGGLWVTDDDPGVLWHVDPVTNRASGSAKTGGSSFGIAVGEGAVWSANPADGTVSRVDPRTERVVLRVHLGHSPVSVAVGYGLVWVGVADTQPFSPHEVPS